MPELPEVERVREGLSRILRDHSVIDSDIIHRHFKPGRHSVPAGFIRDVRRHGKWLLLHVAGRDASQPKFAVVAVNLGMSGKFVETAQRSMGVETPKHTRWRILVGEYTRVPWVLNYVDPRCMGRLRILLEAEAAVASSKSSPSKGLWPLNLGPDWLSPKIASRGSEGVNAVRDALTDTPLPIKRVLMDQSRIAGLGNIYASEACYLARISPERPANTLTRTEVVRLQTRVPEMLRRAIKTGGTSLGDANSYVDVFGKTGRYAEYLRVYGRAEQPCLGGCKSKIVKIKQGGRSTFFCPTCQS